MSHRFFRNRTVRESTPAEPYSELALIYDRVMSHVDYRRWAEYVDRIFRRFESTAGSVLETACGTGSLAAELHRRGYAMTCSDRSTGMVRHAAGKFATLGIPRRLFVADMTAIPLKGPVDAVICLYDSVNYLLDIDTVARAFSEAWNVLRENGLYIFDVCTVANSEMYFADHTMVDRYGGIRCERRCRFDSAGRIQENHFIIVDGGTVYEERHRQKIYWLYEIESAIATTPFTIFGRFNDMSFSPGSERSERVHYVLRK